MALLAGLFLLVGCGSELTSEAALEQIARSEEFQHPFYAPMRVGEQVLIDEDHRQCDRYIEKNYAPLIQAGLVEVKKTDQNSWRTVIDVCLTDAGKKMADTRRGDKKQVYVQVCRMVPCQVKELLPVTENEVIDCRYGFAEREITPFGAYLGYKEGNEHQDTRTFVRSFSGWKLK